MGCVGGVRLVCVGGGTLGCCIVVSKGVEEKQRRRVASPRCDDAAALRCRSPYLWRDPDTFIPERFTGEEAARDAPPLRHRSLLETAHTRTCAHAAASPAAAERFENPDFGGAWGGYNPEAQGSSLYPNEIASDFAFLPFGGGVRKCIGDQFAVTEATVVLVMMLRRFRFRFETGPESVRGGVGVWCVCM